jgi:N-acetylglucosamine-6-phosphate deacetylase
MKVISGGIVYWEGQWRKDIDIILEGDKILNIVPRGKYPDGEVVDVKGHYVCPGFMDIHIHGAMGRDVIEGQVDALQEIAYFLAQHGTTAFLATTITAHPREIRNSLRAIAQAVGKDVEGAQILGAHLEGPFINPKAKGAHMEEYILPATRDGFIELVGGYEDVIKLVTLSPELEGADELVKYLAGKGIVVSMGHTTASYEQCVAGFEWGIRHVTHLYNAMTPLKHREPGAVGAALDNETVTLELITDLIHVHPAALKLAVHVKGPEMVALITDAMAATGLGDGEYALGGQSVVVKEGVARLKGNPGNLAGSTLTQDQALRNLVSIGVPLKDCVSMLTEVPARILGLGYKKGKIKKGFDADLAILDQNLQVAMVYARGNRVNL